MTGSTATRVGFALALGLVGLSLAPESANGAPPEGETEAEVEPPANWRFKQEDKPVKVVVLAGSIGAWQKDPYAEHIGNWCSNVEVKNISKVGEGAYALRKRFMKQVIENRYVKLSDPNYEYWLVFQGGLNSVGTPEKTNKEIRQLFLSAHQRGVSVVGLSLTPWGDDGDSRRWKGIHGLDYKRHTQVVVDFVAGRSTPQQALGIYRDRRDDPEAPWDPAELADVGVDLYDSDLRDRNAPLRDLEKMRKELEKSSDWKDDHADLDDVARAEALERDAQAAAEIPRWYLRSELQSFDDIHPNEHGHRLIAEIACPQLPASWGCSCPAMGSGSPASAE